jgi:peptide/nickel transport system permease protein
MRKIRLNLFMIIGLVILAFFLFVAIFAEQLMPYTMDTLNRPMQSPSSEHIFGTNDIGQDIFSELILGTRVALTIGIVSALIVVTIGTVIGLCSGYLGKRTEKLLREFTAICMAIPSLPLTIVLVTFMRPSMWNIVIAICITAWTSTARVIHAKVTELKNLPFVKIEEALGQRKIVIMFRHLLPNIMDIVLMRATLAVSAAMLTEASLSFLGLGMFDQKSWGSILYYAFHRHGVVAGFTWWYVPPIVCISLCIFSFMLIGYYGIGSSTNLKAEAREVAA